MPKSLDPKWEVLYSVCLYVCDDYYIHVDLSISLQYCNKIICMHNI